jgi:hypothetical protein
LYPDDGGRAGPPGQYPVAANVYFEELNAERAIDGGRPSLCVFREFLRLANEVEPALHSSIGSPIAVMRLLASAQPSCSSYHCQTLVPLADVLLVFDKHVSGRPTILDEQMQTDDWAPVRAET